MRNRQEHRGDRRHSPLRVFLDVVKTRKEGDQVTGPSAPVACAAPSTVPCSFGSAYTDTSPVAAGAKTLLETASMNVHPYSSAELGRNGTTAIATAMPNVPAMTSVRSPTRRTIFPKKYPCTEAAVTPM